VLDRARGLASARLPSIRPHLILVLSVFQGENDRLTTSPVTAGRTLIRMQPDKLSPAQCAEILGIQPRTLRRWSVILATGLSPSAAAIGRKRYYSGSDIQTLRRAQEMMKNGMTLKRIAEVLPIVPADEDKSTSVILSSEMSLAMQEQAMALGALAERGRTISESQEEHEERLKRLEEWSRLPFWKKLTSSPESD